MEFFIGANDASTRHHATEWLRYGGVLHELEAWARFKESQWGECYIFIEVILPRFDRRNNNNQIDLVVSFDERVAMCEMKRHSLMAAIDLRNLMDQVQGQERTFEEILRRGDLRSGFGRLLFFPALRPSDLISLRNAIASAHSRSQFLIAGARSDLRTPAADGSKYHIVDALESGLKSHLTGRQPDGRGTQEYLRRVFTEGGRSLEDPRYNAGDTLAALRSFSRSPYVSFPRHYVEDAHEAEFRQALARLNSLHVVELCGPPEIGKSTLAKELVRELNLQYYELKCDGARSRGRAPNFTDIGRSLEELIEGAPDRLLPDDELAIRLAGKNAIFCIKSYHDSYRLAVSEFLRRFELVASSRQAYCIVESSRPLEGCAHLRVDVAGMSPSKLALLLGQIPPGDLDTSPEVVIDRSYGNPGAAIRIWTANSLVQQTERDFGWFENQLQAVEKRVLAAVCFAIRNAPFGLSVRLLQHFVAAGCPDLPSSSCKNALSRVLGLLKDEQLADVTAFSAQQFGGLLNEVIPNNAELQIVHSLDSRLLAAVGENIESKRAAGWLTALEQVLLETAGPGSLAESIYCLSFEKNLEPFFRSSFRYALLGRIVLDWIDSSAFEPRPGQAYLLKAMRILATMSRNCPLDLEAELGVPNPEDPLQCFAYEFVKARLMVVQRLASELDPAAWRDQIDKMPDLDLRAVWYTSVSAALQEAGHAREAWLLLTKFLEDLKPGTMAATLVRFEMASFINRKSGRALLDRESKSAAAWMTECSRSLVESGLQFENIHLISVGIFYYARAAEFSLGRSQFRKVLAYRSALDWVERVPGSPARWRIRALLTRGSIHRHFVRDGDLPWEEFVVHLKLAWADYDRAFQSAYGAQHSLHTLNAVSYKTGLCRAALRYGDIPTARKEILPFCEEGLAQCELIRDHLDISGKNEIDIWGKIERAETPLKYLTLFARSAAHSPDSTALDEQWSRHVNFILESRAVHDHKAVEDAFKDLYRVFRLAQFEAPTRHKQLLAEIKPQLQRLMRATEPRNTKQKTSPWWEKLSSLIFGNSSQ